MSFAPFEAKMAEVAAEYIQRKDMQLDHVVFHHAGHGWDGKIIYETPAGARGETSHAKIFQTLGDQFPKKEASFANTKKRVGKPRIRLLMISTGNYTIYGNSNGR